MKRTLIMLSVVASALLALVANASATTQPSGGQIHVYGVSRTATTNTLLITGAFATSAVTHNVGKNTGLVTAANGSFKVNLTKLNNAPGTGSINAKTCSGAFMAKGPITLFGGTGAYAGISGTIKLAETFAAILPRKANGKCNENANPTVSLSFFQGSGTVSF
jgi:hypothetical protein